MKLLLKEEKEQPKQESQEDIAKSVYRICTSAGISYHTQQQAQEAINEIIEYFTIQRKQNDSTNLH